MKRNQIAEKQNNPEFIKLLKAKSVAYDTADLWQNVELFIVLFSMIIPIVKFALPGWNPLDYILLGTGILIFVLSLFFDKKKIFFAKVGALVQQKFDNDLFDLNLDISIQEEQINELKKKYKKDDKELHNWYSSMITPELNPNSAILLCQRSNLFWTKGLRLKICSLLVWFGVIYYAIILALGCILDLKLSSFLMSFVAPTFTMILFIVKTYEKQTKIINMCEIQLGIINQLYNRYLKQSILPNNEELTALQNEIFEIRKKPQVLPYQLYQLFRKHYEEITDETAKVYVNKILEKQNNNQ